MNTFEVFFEPGLSLEEVEKSYYLASDKSQMILKYLNVKSTGIMKSQIAEDLNMHPKTVNKYLKILVKYGIVETEELVGKIVYFIV